MLVEKTDTEKEIVHIFRALSAKKGDIFDISVSR